MGLHPKVFNEVLASFLAVWPVERVSKMTIQEYADLSDHDSFCYWLEYGSHTLGAIGRISLNKFEIWKPKEEEKEFKDDRFRYDGEYAWNARMGDTLEQAFFKVRALVLEIIGYAQTQNWSGIDNVHFHAIGKWKTAFLYSNNLLVPFYSQRALRSITKGLGKEFSKSTPVSVMQQFIISHKKITESMEEFAWGLYGKYATKKKARSYYIIGSKFGDENGNDTVPMIEHFIDKRCVSIGFMWEHDFSSLMGANKSDVKKFVSENWKDSKPVWSKIQRYFTLFSRIKEGDIIAVKSYGGHSKLKIIAYAEVVKRNDRVYEYRPDDLGHAINVEFLDTRFDKLLPFNYAETIHELTAKKNGEHFFKIFGWYAEATPEAEANLIEEEDDDELDHQTPESPYNEKSEDPFERTQAASVKVNPLHSRIQNRFVKYLVQTYPQDRKSGEKRRMDAWRETSSEFIIYEIKPNESVYRCVREGIGQLLDYAHVKRTGLSKRIVVVGPNEPEQIDLEFIHAIQKTIQIPFNYIAFDESSLSAKEF